MIPQVAPGRRQLWPLYAAGFVTAFGAHAVAANLGGYATGHHTSLMELGVLLALYDGAEIVLKPVFGAVADRIGPRPVLLGGLLGFALASLLFVLAGEPDFLGAARLAQGMAAAAFSPAASVLVAHVGGGERRGRAFGGYGGAKGVGYLLGPIGGGLLVAAGGYSLLFIVLSVLALAAAMWAVLSVAPVDPQPRSRETLVGLARRLSRKTFVLPVAVLASTTAALSAGVGFLPVQGARAHLGPLATGAIVSVLAAAAAIIQPRAGRALDLGTLPRTAATRISLAAMAAGLVIGGASHGAPGLTAAAFLIGCGVGAATPVGFAALAEASPPGRMGQTMGAGEVGRELGDAGGPLLVGALSALSLGAGLAGLGVLVAVVAVPARFPRIPPPAPAGAGPPVEGAPVEGAPVDGGPRDGPR